MDKKRTPITSFQSYELGGVYNVYEYLDENGEKKPTDRAWIDSVRHTQFHPHNP